MIARKTIKNEKRVILRLIKLYQKTISFDHGWLSYRFPYGCCRFRPTCSEYAYRAIKKYGIVKGGVLACWRILRCNPFNRGGWDPI